MPESLTDSGALAIVNDVRAYVAEVEEKVVRSPGGTTETALILIGVALREIGHALRSVMLTASAVRKIYRAGFADGRAKGREEGRAEGYAAAVTAMAGQKEAPQVPLQLVRPAS